MPGVASIDALLQAAAEFVVADLDLAAEPPARAAVQRSLDDSGLVLLGEVHGVRENPLLIRALMRTFGLTSLALEWHEDLAPVIRTFLARGELADHWLLWSGDGRITAGHLAVLAERAAAGPLDLILFDGTMGMGWSWSQRDEAMAGRLLAAAAPGARTLVVAGNAHTPTSPTSLGVRWGPAWPGSALVSGRSASTTAAARTTTRSRAGSRAPARVPARYGFACGAARSCSTFPSRRRRPCPSGPGLLPPTHGLAERLASNRHFGASYD